MSAATTHELAATYEAGRRDGLIAATTALADTIRIPETVITVTRRRAVRHACDGHHTHRAFTRHAAIGAAVAALPCTHAITLEEVP